MGIRKLGHGSTSIEERDAVSTPLDEVLHRLEALERRLARLEAAAGLLPPAPRASNADAFLAAAKTSAQAAGAATMPPPQAAAGAKNAATAPSAVVAAGSEPKSHSDTATAPATERLRPLPSAAPAAADAPFPDLSLLDEKVERKKGPAQRLEVRAAIEDYPRITSRIQQLWGTPECEGYLNNLVIDTRGNRKGFPPAVMEELLYLGRLARALVILGIDGDLWEAYDQIGDRR
jgi:hypothetical protein